MNRWRSLLVWSGLLAMMALLLPATALAQPTIALPTMLEVGDAKYDSFTVEWEHVTTAENQGDPAGNVHPADFFLQWHIGSTFVSGRTLAGTKTVKAEAREGAAEQTESYETTISDLQAGTIYVVRITARPAAGTTAKPASADATGPTDGADAPDDVDGLMLKTGDGLILAMWDMASDNGSPVTGYELQMKMSDEPNSKFKTVREGADAAGEPQDGDSTDWTISNLTNGVEYDVRVRAYSYGVTADDDDGWSDVESAMPMAGAGTPTTTPTPTPALPLFGVVALGAGLFAAGRRRLRRRQELLNS